ncbi:hypothetical protein C8R43DRAFT_976536, partial [Mycena crocata]
MPPCSCLEYVLHFSAYLFCVVIESCAPAASSELWGNSALSQYSGRFRPFRSLPADGFPFLAKNANMARELPYLAHVIRAESGQL